MFGKLTITGFSGASPVTTTASIIEIRARIEKCIVAGIVEVDRLDFYCREALEDNGE